MFTLTNEQVAFYNERGYLRLRNVFAPDEVEFQSVELERLMLEWRSRLRAGVAPGARRT